MMWFKRVNKRNLISNIVVIAALLAFSISSADSKTLPGIINLIFIYSPKQPHTIFNARAAIE